MSKPSDPVAEKSGFLRMYMSGHPDTLVAYAKWYGKVQEAITSAEMIAIDTKSMTLSCVLKTGGKKDVYVSIDPPLRGYEDVKPRLIEMKAIAQEGLGMVKAPRISTFEFTPEMLIATVTVSLLSYFAYAPQGTSPLFYPAYFVRRITGHTILKFIANSMFFFHGLECLYTLHLCRKHFTGFALGMLYGGATLLFGFPVWKSLRKRIQDARIDSVMKGQ
ncbi:hypothetical protein AGABI2DRAFT_195662 [Agaricus bisporus var. bisporus H97]|uniref:hypothetical protein n=1 Tax=Agaricus bisporus var. bisporus (strain H97 / ATCC MYA-4626 / FGSC 10389) TaxID=936046 RepID=UPI00029F6EAA|nr:hypothetical protein AGABI2DRAFT_195662 [Agaricus bisporus var. bisporus H97]EKV42909.1 hypothetical protein AGABI2DRAFT_195662 [Agaricus bisporus var. bisporus H97]